MGTGLKKVHHRRWKNFSERGLQILGVPPPPFTDKICKVVFEVLPYDNNVNEALMAELKLRLKSKEANWFKIQACSNWFFKLKLIEQIYKSSRTSAVLSRIFSLIMIELVTENNAAFKKCS